ncbi:PREDICTED: WD repeat-containing protein VIP3-like [Condylura cristata]|uniref:WD repeat-containing protein VIP3-like n=1 Tax=Condylura cristata TaxID=143302 RepID=UPI000642D470|nr:PREDICTED: WD repeat-containing protein VIP3-like [Condylura cristata]
MGRESAGATQRALPGAEHPEGGAMGPGEAAARAGSCAATQQSSSARGQAPPLNCKGGPSPVNPRATPAVNTADRRHEAWRPQGFRGQADLRSAAAPRRLGRSSWGHAGVRVEAAAGLNLPTACPKPESCFSAGNALFPSFGHSEDVSSLSSLLPFSCVVDAWTLAFSPDSQYLATGTHVGKVNIFGVESGKKEYSLDTRGKFILSIAYSPDGKYLASGAIDGIINIFDIATGKLLHTLEGHAMPIRSLTFSPDSQLLVTASDDGYIKIYDVQHASLAGTLSGHASWVLGVAFCPDDTHFVSRWAPRGSGAAEVSRGRPPAPGVHRVRLSARLTAPRALRPQAPPGLNPAPPWGCREDPTP